MNEELKTWLGNALNDPIASTLLKYSNLTKTQFESLLIDLATENLSINGLKYEEKAKIRSKAVSRGSFNRSLSQARKNIIASIYTVLLLSYIGLLRGSVFEEYEILAERLRDYMTLYTSYAEDPRAQTNLLKNIERELFEVVEKLAKPKELKPPKTM